MGRNQNQCEDITELSKQIEASLEGATEVYYEKMTVISRAFERGMKLFYKYMILVNAQVIKILREYNQRNTND